MEPCNVITLGTLKVQSLDLYLLRFNFLSFFFYGLPPHRSHRLNSAFDWNLSCHLLADIISFSTYHATMAVAERDTKAQRNGVTNSYNDKRNGASEKHG
jgi:hypothetical protein